MIILAIEVCASDRSEFAHWLHVLSFWKCLSSNPCKGESLFQTRIYIRVAQNMVRIMTGMYETPHSIRKIHSFIGILDASERGLVVLIWGSAFPIRFGRIA